MRPWVWGVLVAIAVLGGFTPALLQWRARADFLDDRNWRFAAEERAKATLKPYRSDHRRFTRIYRVTVEGENSAVADVQFFNAFTFPQLPPGQKATLRFWIRSRRETGVLVRLSHARSAKEYAWQQFVVPEAEWHMVVFVFTPEADAAGPSTLTFLLGGDASTYDLGGISLKRTVPGDLPRPRPSASPSAKKP